MVRKIPTGSGARAEEALQSKRSSRMSDVAKIAGVSAMTVSRAMREPDVVTPETLKKIHDAIEQINYLPNRVAGSLSSKRSNIVGLVVPSLHNSLFVETIQGVADTLGGQQDLLIADSGYSLKREEAAVAAFLSQRVGGMILHNTKHTPRTRKLIQEAGVPCVETGNLVRHPLDMAVSFSNHDAAFAMTEYLIESGYRRIGFVSLPRKDNDRAGERYEGYLAALEKHKLTVDSRIILEATPGLKSGSDALTTLLACSPRPDAVFLTGDVLAAGALFEANRLGLRIPQDIAIAGSDDSELHEQMLPPLTSIRFPRYEIGRRAASMLIDRIKSKSSGSAILDLGFEIIKRQST